MARTTRHDNGLNKGRDDKPMGAKCKATTGHPKGFDTREDDHGHYGAGGSRACKQAATAALRIYGKKVLHAEMSMAYL